MLQNGRRSCSRSTDAAEAEVVLDNAQTGRTAHRNHVAVDEQALAGPHERERHEAAAAVLHDLANGHALVLDGRWRDAEEARTQPPARDAILDAHAQPQRRLGVEPREHDLAVPTDRPAPEASCELEPREAGTLHVAPRRQELRGMQSRTFALVAAKTIERAEVAPRLEAQTVHRVDPALAIDEQEPLLARETHT